jgi:hypothetical protein
MANATLPPKDDQEAMAAHKELRFRIEHVLARMKDWQMLRQCRRRKRAIDLAVCAVAYLWSLRLTDLRINS